MPNEKKKFRVLSDVEFWNLTRQARMQYLNAALEYSEIHKAAKPDKPRKTGAKK